MVMPFAQDAGHEHGIGCYEIATSGRLRPLRLTCPERGRPDATIRAAMDFGTMPTTIVSRGANPAGFPPPGGWTWEPLGTWLLHHARHDP